MPNPTHLACVLWLTLSLGFVGYQTSHAQGAAAAPVRSIADGPDPREIPLPEIKTPLSNLPGPADLPVIKELPPVLIDQAGRRVRNAEQWRQRREEMKTLLMGYATGLMPPAPGNVKGKVLAEETLAPSGARYRLVHLSFGPGETLSLDIGVLTPSGTGPFPAVVFPGGTAPGATPLVRQPMGPNQGRGQNVLMLVGPGPEPKLPPPPRVTTSAADLATQFSLPLSRGYAVVLFNPNDCAEDTTLRNEDGTWAFRNTRFFPAYPGYDWGVLAAWAWGASRIADYLEQDPLIDKSRLIITGISRTGKSAMIAAAFDERFMGAPVVTGGGGIGAFRPSGIHRGGREGLGEMMNKYPNWFAPKLRQFWTHTDKLPFDTHWFLALCAPRPFIALEGDTDQVSLPLAVKQAILSARPAYELLGAGSKLGVHYAKHGHTMDAQDWTAMLDFADLHLSGKASERRFDQFLPEPAPAVLTAPFSVRDFGAFGDGEHLDTRAFQRALDTCALTGGGEVVVPAGRYRIGSIQLGYRTTLRLEEGSVLLGSDDITDYPLIDVRWEGRWQPGHRALIHAANVDHIGIVGPGHIEGSPKVAASQNPRGAVVIETINCNQVLMEGFSVNQGGNWATHPTYTNDLVMRKLRIRGLRDGIDIDSCSRVRIEDCDIDTGDDAISLKSGRGMDGARISRPTEDVVITGCRLQGRRFACIGIGSETSGGIRNVRIEKTTFVDSYTHAIYIKTRTGRAGVIENIVCEDLEVLAGNFLRLNLVSAGNTNTVDDAVEGPLGYPRCRNFRFSGVRVACKTLVEGFQISPENPLDGLVLEKITGTCTKGIELHNVQNLGLGAIEVTGHTGELLTLKNVTQIKGLSQDTGR